MDRSKAVISVKLFQTCLKIPPRLKSLNFFPLFGLENADFQTQKYQFRPQLYVVFSNIDFGPVCESLFCGVLHIQGSMYAPVFVGRRKLCIAGDSPAQPARALDFCARDRLASFAAVPVIWRILHKTNARHRAPGHKYNGVCAFSIRAYISLTAF
jgi:hypothetical protein